MTQDLHFIYMSAPLGDPGKVKPVRPAISLAFVQPSDAKALANILIHAFHGDPNTDGFHPERAGLTAEEKVQRFERAVARGLQKSIVGNDVYVKASIRERDARGRLKEIIVGWACWETPNKTRMVPLTMWEWFLAWVVYPLRDYVLEQPRPWAHEIKELFATMYQATFGRGGLGEGQKPWHLHILCVHPRWQGIYAGRTLLEWGMERAKKDNAPIYLESSPGATEFYISKGFEYTSFKTCVSNGITINLPGMIWFPRVGRV